VFREFRFEVLGPVRGWHQKNELELGSPQQRAVLAMLLIARGRQVSMDGIIGGLWGEHVPRSAVGTIRTYVSRLRGVLGDQAGAPHGEPIRSIGDGYVLQAGGAVLDLDVFEQRLSAARGEHDTERRARLLRDALGLWRGVVLAGVPGPYADSRRVPLTEMHMAATEEKLAADIVLGEDAAAIVELRALLAEHPFRERLTELLMHALYKSGRQAEALDAFERMRRRLGDELGIDPGPSLQALRQRVLRADRRLMGAAGTRPALLAGAPGAARVA
jgi:DNA-binding SARP family transcriptional activator